MAKLVKEVKAILSNAGSAARDCVSGAAQAVCIAEVPDGARIVAVRPHRARSCCSAQRA
jgi:hypothetical protein